MRNNNSRYNLALMLFMQTSVLLSCSSTRNVSGSSDSTAVDTTSLSTDLPDLYRQTTFRVYNNSSIDITLKVGLDSGNLNSAMLIHKATWVSPRFNQGEKPYLKISTLTKSLIYKMNLGQDYMLFFNNQKRLWDVVKVNN